MSVTVNRKTIRFYPNPKRVITKHYMPGNEKRALRIISTVLAMREDESRDILNQTLRNFSTRHRNITRIFEKSFECVRYLFSKLDQDAESLPIEKKLVIGAYFTMEYSIESVAFFNPSIVEDPYQGNLSKGQKRVILSFRATGEGHISSIAFRSGIIDEHNDCTCVPPGELVDVPEIITRHTYDKTTFMNKLGEMKIDKDDALLVMDQLGETFIYGELLAAAANVKKEGNISLAREQTIQTITWLATSHYEVTFSLDTALSERVLFPVSYSESNGIEDARFVRFIDDDGSVTYYATYTAYNGYTILPKLIETKDFYNFKVMPINGEYGHNKGLALFPRKINGQYAMLARIDGENNYIMFADTISLWRQAKKIEEPIYPWELVQVGNAGSPIETEQGWLVITHGVGPMRTYCLSAILLDRKDPGKLIGRLKEPLLTTTEEERSGYVPNVVYSCGAMINNGELILPYAMSDYASTYATVPLDELMRELLAASPNKRHTDQKNRSFSILLVEDDRRVRTIIERYLLQEGYGIHLASDGIDALMRIARKPFDLIISDIKMPTMDGLQLLGQMKEKGIEIPLIFITGYHNEELESQSRKLGAVDYLVKPVTKKLLIEKIQHILQK